MPGFEFRRFPLTRPVPQGYVRLGLNGPLLSRDDQAAGLLILDGTWRWAARMEAQTSEIPVRSLPPLETAYPRSSKVFDDPCAGLATVEAIFAAYLILGRTIDGILDRYHWRNAFLERNAEQFRQLGFNCQEQSLAIGESGSR